MHRLLGGLFRGLYRACKRLTAVRCLHGCVEQFILCQLPVYLLALTSTKMLIDVVARELPRRGQVAHNAGNRANEEIIKRVDRYVLRGIRVLAVNSRQLPFHPVTDQFFQTFARSAGHKLRRAAEQTFAYVGACQLIDCPGNSLFDIIIERTLAVGLALQTGDIEHLLCEDFLCRHRAAVGQLLAERRTVIPRLLRAAAERTERKRQHTAGRSQQRIRCHVRAALCCGRQRVKRHTAKLTGPTL